MGPRILFFLLLVSVLAHASLAADWGLDDLMSALAQKSDGRARFSEKKFIAMLDKPVESSGYLVYVRPGHLEKNTLKPLPERLTLESGTLSIEQTGQKQSLQLSDYPELASFIESLRGTLAGDRNALERVYRLYLGGSSTHWTLLLLPSAPEMAATISQIKITGAGDQLRSIEIQQMDGDRSVMDIKQIVAAP